MNPRQHFEREVAQYQERTSGRAVDRLYLVLAGVVRWTREHGHGSCILNAVDHSLGSKIKMTTVKELDQK